tara:strand:- start:244 stop:681 length:438 start_codon:yes stop_codon:yes gene_type:complete
MSYRASFVGKNGNASLPGADKARQPYDGGQNVKRNLLPRPIQTNLDLAKNYRESGDYGSMVLSLHQVKVAAKILGNDTQTSEVTSGLEENVKGAVNSALEGDIPATSSYLSLSKLDDKTAKIFLSIAQEARYERPHRLNEISDDM